MTRRVTSLQIVGVLGVVSGIVIAACSAAFSGSVATPPPPLPGGELSISIRTITSEQLAAKAESLSFDDGPLQPRDCAPHPCSARISAVKGQTVGPTNVSANGTIVARMRAIAGNGAAVEAKYGLRPGRPNAYYLIAEQGATPGTWIWTLWRVVNDGNAQRPDSITWGNWVTCSHTPPNPPVASMFWSCAKQQGGGPPFVVQLQDPGWLTCDAGCCTAGS